MAVNSLNNIGSVGGRMEPTVTPARPRDVGNGPTFANTFEKALAKQVGTHPPAGDINLRFSHHAVERMQLRGIRYTPEQLGKINAAVEKAAGKGARETLVLLDDSAMIVSHKNNTVVTVMDRATLKENVFTNIDSTVVI